LLSFLEGRMIWQACTNKSVFVGASGPSYEVTTLQHSRLRTACLRWPCSSSWSTMADPVPDTKAAPCGRLRAPCSSRPAWVHSYNNKEWRRVKDFPRHKKWGRLSDLPNTKC
jgi:hypothetical protein